MYCSSCPHVSEIANFSPENIVSKTSCEICGICGPNLWICISSSCDLFVGCGEGVSDHSTQHFRLNPCHRLTLNSTTFRVWCYECETEVFIDNNITFCNNLNNNINKYNRKPILANQVYIAEITDEDTEDEEELLIENDGKPLGLTGLQNLGNTCYMNAALQSLSNCPQLTRFMIDCQSYIRKPGIAKSYWRLIKEIWDIRRPSYVVPSGISHGIKAIFPLFRGYTQQDAQEFLRCFLDQLHEELKEGHYNDIPCLAHSMNYNNSNHNNDNNNDNNVIMNEMSDTETNSDADYETCDSGLSSEKSAFEDDITIISNDEMIIDSSGVDMNERSSPSPSLSSIPPLPPLSSSPTSNASNHCSNSTQTQSHRNMFTEKVRRSVSYRSIISDIFDGRILSSVQCLKCDNISTTRETFQDLSLPIPSREQLMIIRQQQQQQNCGKSSDANNSNSSSINSLSIMNTSLIGSNSNLMELTKNNVTGIYSWIWEWIDWVMGWILGPNVSLQDCLSAFFSADELKGDNMYSCEKCQKLRNGVKYSKVLELPEILSIHLKRFRHELMYSSKISTHVTFPLEGLDMSSYMARNDSSVSTTYDLVAVVCHHGTAASGHYTAYALNHYNQSWYEFDDQYVTSVDCQQVINCDAYVLFYRKSTDEMNKHRIRAHELMKLSRNEPSLLQFYVSKQWVNKFNTFSEPGPITNCDFLCEHGGVDPYKASFVHELCTVFSHSVWEYVHNTFGGGPTCTKLYICQTCSLEKDNLDKRRRYEYETFTRFNQTFINQRTPVTVCAISMAWFKEWEAFVRCKTNDVPPPINNQTISTLKSNGQSVLKVGSDYATISLEMWNFLVQIYSGGPLVGHQFNRKNTSNTSSQSPQLSNSNNNLSCNKSQSKKEPKISDSQELSINNINNCLNNSNTDSESTFINKTNSNINVNNEIIEEKSSSDSDNDSFEEKTFIDKNNICDKMHQNLDQINDNSSHETNA